MFTSTSRNFVGLTLEADGHTVRQHTLVVEPSYSPALHDWLAGAGIEFLFDPNPPARWQASGMVAYHLVKPPADLVEVLRRKPSKVLNSEATFQLPQYRGQTVKLSGRSSYLAKDQAKSDQANKFIGRGSSRSSTHQYSLDWGARANCGNYISQDVVFVSAEGNRSGLVKPDLDELTLAVIAGVTFITDKVADRNRPYNVGEREVAGFLASQGYRETSPGRWTR
jgi:hypothetical protein